MADKEGRVNNTCLVYRANLNFRWLERYMEALKERDLIRENSVGSDALFGTIERGREFLSRYRMARDLIWQLPTLKLRFLSSILENSVSDSLLRKRQKIGLVHVWDVV